MAHLAENLAILGSTGSIGRSTLEVVQASAGRFKVVGLTANRNLDLLCRQAREFRPKWVVAADKNQAANFDWSVLPAGVERLVGEEGLQQLVSDGLVDKVVAAIVGSAGLMGTWRSIDAGKTVALANKETLVMAGQPVMELAHMRKVSILPVDSEHSAIFQAVQSGRSSEVRRIVLTASGGPFRRYSPAQLEHVTVEDALTHPTWEMGPKITVDSATMMNKALEVVEARWLFDLAPDQISVTIHPQSIVHSMVEFVDGAVVAQLSPPDMRLPIQYALTWPERISGPAAKMNWENSMSLEFSPPSDEQFPALSLGFRVAREGGTSGAVLNAANEVAVAGFLDRKIPFTQIVPLCRAALDQHAFQLHPTLEQLIRVDEWTRQEVIKWIGS